jgi:hypothetical protein
MIHATTPDGLWGVIQAKDLPPGIARSKTRDNAADALTAPWDPAQVAPVGPKSQNHFVKVKLSDLPPNFFNGQPPVRPQVVLRPGDYANPKVGKYIPEYPHTCNVCGGKMLWLFSSQEHEGKMPCPGPKAKLRR